MNKGFFQCTNQALDEISNLYIAIWGIDVGLQNFRRNFFDDYRKSGTIKKDELNIKYCSDCRVSSLDYEKTFITKSWAEQEEEIAWLLLNSLIPIFEGWWEEIKRTRLKTIPSKTILKPDSYAKKVKTFTNLSAHCSKDAQNIFGETYKSSDKYIKQDLELHYICFHLFKCMRNAYMHNGRIAHLALIKTQSEYLSKVSTEKLGVTLAPEFYAARLNERIRADLYGIVGFSDVLIRIITTLDAELMDTIGGDEELAERITETKFREKIDTTTEDKEIKKIITKIFKEAGFSTPKDFKAALNYLKGRHVIQGTLSSKSRLK